MWFGDTYRQAYATFVLRGARRMILLSQPGLQYLETVISECVGKLYLG